MSGPDFHDVSVKKYLMKAEDPTPKSARDSTMHSLLGSDQVPQRQHNVSNTCVLWMSPSIHSGCLWILKKHAKESTNVEDHSHPRNREYYVEL